MALNALANCLDMPRMGLVAALANSKPFNKDIEQKALDLPVLGVRHKSQKIWQGWKDSNLRMPESKSGALTNLATPLHRTVAVDRQPLGTVTSATHLSIVARKHFLEPGFYQPARGCASRLPHCLICQSPGASESIISFGIRAKTALPEPVIRPCKPCAASQFRD